MTKQTPSDRHRARVNDLAKEMFDVDLSFLESRLAYAALQGMLKSEIRQARDNEDWDLVWDLETLYNSISI